MRADTLDVAPEMQEAVDDCVANSAACRTLVDSLRNDTGYHVVKVGVAGDCGPFRMVACIDFAPPPGHASGSTITIIPGDFTRLGYPIDAGDAVSHEMAHASVCRNISESCALRWEREIRRQRGRPPRPEGT